MLLLREKHKNVKGKISSEEYRSEQKTVDSSNRPSKIFMLYLESGRNAKCLQGMQTKHMGAQQRRNINTNPGAGGVLRMPPPDASKA